MARYDLTGFRVDVGYTSDESKAIDYVNKNNNNKYEYYYIEIKEVLL